jgi:hypothetical protein
LQISFDQLGLTKGRLSSGRFPGYFDGDRGKLALDARGRLELAAIGRKYPLRP